MGMTSVRLPDEIQDKLEQTAERLQRSKGWIINEALAEFLAREERKAQRHQETLEALSELKDGQLIEGEEIMDWLESWGTDAERDPPRP